MTSSSDHSSLPTNEKAVTASPDDTQSGVDRSLIRWMLSLSPTERLLAIQQQVNAIQELRE